MKRKKITDQVNNLTLRQIIDEQNAVYPSEDLSYLDEIEKRIQIMQEEREFLKEISLYDGRYDDAIDFMEDLLYYKKAYTAMYIWHISPEKNRLGILSGGLLTCKSDVWLLFALNSNRMEYFREATPWDYWYPFEGLDFWRIDTSKTDAVWLPDCGNIYYSGHADTFVCTISDVPLEALELFVYQGHPTMNNCTETALAPVEQVNEFIKRKTVI